MESCQSMFTLMKIVIVWIHPSDAAVYVFQIMRKTQKYVPGKTMKNPSTLFNRI